MKVSIPAGSPVQAVVGNGKITYRGTPGEGDYGFKVGNGQIIYAAALGQGKYDFGVGNGSILVFAITGVHLMLVDSNYLGIGNFEQSVGDADAGEAHPHPHHDQAWLLVQCPPACWPGDALEQRRWRSVKRLSHNSLPRVRN